MQNQIAHFFCLSYHYFFSFLWDSFRSIKIHIVRSITHRIPFPSIVLFLLPSQLRHPLSPLLFLIPVTEKGKPVQSDDERARGRTEAFRAVENARFYVGLMLLPPKPMLIIFGPLNRFKQLFPQISVLKCVR